MEQLKNQIKIGLSGSLRLVVPTSMADQFNGAALKAKLINSPAEVLVVIETDPVSRSHFGAVKKNGSRVVTIPRHQISGLIHDFTWSSCKPTSVEWDDGRLVLALPPDRWPPIPKVRRPKPEPDLPTVEDFRAAIKTINRYLDANADIEFQVTNGRLSAIRTELFE